MGIEVTAGNVSRLANVMRDLLTPPMQRANDAHSSMLPCCLRLRLAGKFIVWHS